MSITKSVFGMTKDGKQVDSFLIENNNNMKINLITYGATLQSILVKDKSDNEIDLLLGFDDMEGFENRHDYQGMIVGPVANRISAGGLTIDGVGDVNLRMSIYYFEKIEILMDWFEQRNVEPLKQQLKLYKLMLLEEGILRVLLYSENLILAIKETKRICEKERYQTILAGVSYEQINEEKKKLILALKNGKYYKLYFMFLPSRLKRKVKKMLRR